METIYTILFTAPHMEPLMFAALSRSKLASKVRRHVDELVMQGDIGGGKYVNKYADVKEAAGWLTREFGYQFEITVHTED